MLRRFTFFLAALAIGFSGGRIGKSSPMMEEPAMASGLPQDEAEPDKDEEDEDSKPEANQRNNQHQSQRSEAHTTLHQNTKNI